MPVIYGSTSIRPAPQVTFTRNLQLAGDGRRLGTTVTATLHGTLTAQKTDDVETPLAIEQRLSAILAKQAELRNVFAEDGDWFEVQGLDGSAPVKFQAVIDSIEFQEGPWVDRCDYTVTLHGEEFADATPTEDNHIESATESWQFEEGEGPHTYRATHTLTAKGKNVYDPSGNITKFAWQNAKDFISNKLGLDWTTQNAEWSPMSGQQIYQDGLIQPDALLPFNRVIQETADEFEGTYSATETFFVSQNPYWEDYTVSVRKELTTPTQVTVVSINGTIHGLATGLHNPEGRLANAQTRWDTVQTILLTRASAYAGGATLNPKPLTSNVDQNINEGTVSYQYEFSDRKLVNHTYEFYNVSMQASLEDGKTTVTIEGSITGVIYPDDVPDPNLRYSRASAQWELVKLLIFSRAVSDSGISDLKPFPLSANVTPNKQDGVISYNYSFDNRDPETVHHEFTVSTRFSREDGRTIVGISGTITGLRYQGSEFPFTTFDREERYRNALAYYNTIGDNLIGLASGYVDVSEVNPNPFNKSLSHLPNGGQVTYEYEYNSIPSPCIQGALSENITVTDDAATKVIAIIPVLGRAKGPVMQDIGTVKEKRRTLTIEVVMPTNMESVICGSGAVTPTVSVDISPYAPQGSPVYLESDQTQWSPSTGHYTRTVSWIYE